MQNDINKTRNNTSYYKTSLVKIIGTITCGLFIFSMLAGCYGPTQLVDDLLGRRRFPMTESEAEQWLEENYSHDMTIL